MLKRVKIITIAIIVLFILTSISSHIYYLYIAPKQHIKELSQINVNQITNMYNINDEIQMKSSDTQYVNIIKILDELENLEEYPIPSGKVSSNKRDYSFRIKTNLKKPLDTIYLVVDSDFDSIVIRYTDGLINKTLTDIILKSNEKTSKLISDIVNSK